MSCFCRLLFVLLWFTGVLAFLLQTSVLLLFKALSFLLVQFGEQPLCFLPKQGSTALLQVSAWLHASAQRHVMEAGPCLGISGLKFQLIQPWHHCFQSINSSRDQFSHICVFLAGSSAFAAQSVPSDHHLPNQTCQQSHMMRTSLLQ